ncbi:MAG: hypothetical protein WC443_05615 [Desulfobaccales bacterium]
MTRYFFRIVLGLLLVIGWSGSAAADWKLDIGYPELQAELGSDLPTGAGVGVTQIEASSGMPDPSNAQFAGKTFTLNDPSLAIAGHATTVGTYFYGNSSSIAPGITDIDCFGGGIWAGWGFLTGDANSPLATTSRVANHSYVTYYTNTSMIQTLTRMDWVVARDEYIQVVAMNNGSTNYPIMGSSFNAIAVGLSSGNSAHGTYPITTTPITPYASSSRTRPDLVAPASATSYATPMVASAAALLVEAGHKGGNTLSTDPSVKSTTNRSGETIYNAERSEVVKAALMAGASRTSPNLKNSVTPGGYTVNTANGLNNIYGAGQLNIYDSYHVIAAGEQNSREDFASGGGEILAKGFDYDPQFGGLSGSNRTGSYVFKALTTGSLSASLVWNLAVTGETASGFDTSASLYHLGLYLYDMSSSSELAYAASMVDNTENIWWSSLIPNHSYMLAVKALQSDFLWDYGLAWNITATTTHAPVPATVYLLGTGLLAVILLRRKGRVHL